MSLENVEAYESFPAMKVIKVTAPNGYDTLKSLFSEDQLAKISGRAVGKVVIQQVSASVNIADNATPGTDVGVIATTDKYVELKAINALDQVFVDDGAGTATIVLLVYLA